MPKFYIHVTNLETEAETADEAADQVFELVNQALLAGEQTMIGVSKTPGHMDAQESKGEEMMGDRRVRDA